MEKSGAALVDLTSSKSYSPGPFHLRVALPLASIRPYSSCGKIASGTSQSRTLFSIFLYDMSPSHTYRLGLPGEILAMRGIPSTAKPPSVSLAINGPVTIGFRPLGVRCNKDRLSLGNGGCIVRQLIEEEYKRCFLPYVLNLPVTLTVKHPSPSSPSPSSRLHFSLAHDPFLHCGLEG